MQSVPSTTKVVSWNPVRVEVYSIQHYHVIKFVGDFESGVNHHNPNPQYSVLIE